MVVETTHLGSEKEEVAHGRSSSMRWFSRKQSSVDISLRTSVERDERKRCEQKVLFVCRRSQVCVELECTGQLEGRPQVSSSSSVEL